MGAASAIVDALAARRFAPCRLALVVAHPDDETVAAGGSLHLLPGLLLVHVTDGAPRRLGDAGRAGFAGPGAYAAARQSEMAAALHLAGVAPIRVRLEVPDQDATFHLVEIAAALDGLFARHGIEAVLTHAYEGGHPDHDATACAVHRSAGRAGVPVLEFPAYRSAPGGGTLAQSFLPGPPETCIRLSIVEKARKRAMLDCFRTQAAVLAMFDPGVERFRPAAATDFTAPPHLGQLNYEAWGWEMTGNVFRTVVGRTQPCAA